MEMCTRKLLVFIKFVFRLSPEDHMAVHHLKIQNESTKYIIKYKIMALERSIGSCPIRVRPLVCIIYTEGMVQREAPCIKANILSFSGVFPHPRHFPRLPLFSSGIQSHITGKSTMPHLFGRRMPRKVCGNLRA